MFFDKLLQKLIQIYEIVTQKIIQKQIKKDSHDVSLFKMPLARLELAPRVNPDWILSPTRLPIPPQGHADY